MTSYVRQVSHEVRQNIVDLFEQDVDESTRRYAPTHNMIKRSFYSQSVQVDDCHSYLHHTPFMFTILLWFTSLWLFQETRSRPEAQMAPG